MGLVATVVGAAAAVVAIPLAAWQVGLAVSDRRRQRDERARARDQTPSPEQSAGDAVDVTDVRSAYERAPRLDVEDPERLAEAEALLAAMPTDSLPGRSALPAGSLMPVASNPLFVGRANNERQFSSSRCGSVTRAA